VLTAAVQFPIARLRPKRRRRIRSIRSTAAEAVRHRLTRRVGGQVGLPTGAATRLGYMFWCVSDDDREKRREKKHKKHDRESEERKKKKKDKKKKKSKEEKDM
jgi:hypothetical protein